MLAVLAVVRGALQRAPLGIAQPRENDDPIAGALRSIDLNPSMDRRSEHLEVI
jgi:hypothetical protein